MPLSLPTSLPLDPPRHLERWIDQRTGGRVHRLHAHWRRDGHVLISGSTGSYYVRQLALAAVLEWMEKYDTEAPPSVEMSIAVRSRPRFGDRPIAIGAACGASRSL